MKNTDFMNLSLPEGSDKIDIEILNSDFTAIENLLEQHAIIETMTLNGEGVIIGAIGPYIRLQNIDAVQVSIDIGEETFTLASGENIVIRETTENIGIITSGDVHITYFVNPKTYADKEFYTKEKVDELLSNVEANVEVDTELSETSENPVQNKIITEQFSHYYTAAETINAIIEKVAEIVAGAPEDFDTLKELSDWLKQHENSAASMNSAIQKNAEDIETANTNIQKNVDDISVVNEQIADIYNRCGGGKNICPVNSGRVSASGGYAIGGNATKQKIDIKAGRVIVSWDGTATTGSSEIGFFAGETKVISVTKTNKTSITFDVELDSDVDGMNLYCNRECVFSNVMIRYADIKDDTYAAYIPTNKQLYEQVNAVTARIAALEGTTTTTEGGE